MGPQLRHLFAVILVFGQPADPLSLWNQFLDDLCDDLRRHGNPRNAERRCYDEINEILRGHNVTLEEKSIQRPDGIDLPEEDVIDRAALLDQGWTEYDKMNDVQKAITDRILAAADRFPELVPGEQCYFLDGPGGTGTVYFSVV